MSDGNDKRNRTAAFLAIIAVIVLCILALFVAVRILRDTDFSSIKLPFLSPAESPSPSGVLPSTEPRPTSLPSASAPLPSSKPSPTPDPLAGFESVFFGQYQDNPIEWIVLDSEENRMLLLSKRAVETLPYHNTDEDVTWETSSLRSWLNGEFLETAFSSEEISSVLPTVLDNSGVNPEYHYTEGSAPTEDKVFLLSHDEAALYLPEEALRLCEKSLHAPSYEDDISSWWLRSPGLWPNCAEYVYRTGAFFSGVADRMFVDARPAMWIETTDGIQ